MTETVQRKKTFSELSIGDVVTDQTVQFPMLVYMPIYGFDSAETIGFQIRDAVTFAALFGAARADC